MKKLGFALVAVTLIAAVSARLLFAGGACCMAGEADKQVQKMSKKLNLNADQQSQLKKIMEEKHQKMEDVMKQAQGVEDEYSQKVGALLSGEQKEKFEKMQGKKKDKMGRHCGG